MSKRAKAGSERILVLCVDRDDDLGVKAEVKTPTLGRKENVNAALNLVLRDPEEPDANAMFEAIKIYDRLRKGSEDKEKFQVATITGSKLGGFEADRKLVSELNKVLEVFPPSDVILVTDGYSDEAALQIIQSRAPVTSVRRIVVKHSETIEESAAVFSRYLKMLFENPHYARIVLGLPGILLIVFSVLWLLDLWFYASIALLLVIGVFLLVRGFGINKALLGLFKRIYEYSPPPLTRVITSFALITGVLLIVIGCYQAGSSITPLFQPFPTDLGQWLVLLPRLLGRFLSQSITLIVIGICIILSGRIVNLSINRDPKLLRTIVIFVLCAWSQQIFYQASQILINPTLPYSDLVFAIVIGILLTLSGITITFLMHRIYANFFEEKKERIDEFKEG